MNLGDKVKHRVSGFEGKVTSICHNLFGNDRIAVTALDEDGDKHAEHWFYVEELEGVG